MRFVFMYIHIYIYLKRRPPIGSGFSSSGFHLGSVLTPSITILVPFAFLRAPFWHPWEHFGTLWAPFWRSSDHPADSESSFIANGATGSP